MTGIKIRALLNGGELAIVETKGLRRLQLTGGDIVGDLYTIREAAAAVAVMPDQCRAVSYPELSKIQGRKVKDRRPAKSKSRRKVVAA